MKSKRERTKFDFCCYDDIAKYLSEKHKEGWKFVSSTGLKFFDFEQCEPDDVTYILDFDKYGISYGKEEYLEGFRQKGWEYVGICGDYNIFCKRTALVEKDGPLHIDRSEQIKRMEKHIRSLLVSLISGVILMMTTCSIFFETGNYLWFVAIVIVYVLNIPFVYKSWKNYSRAKKRELNK
ncbi:MAG: DUF2812 domain-containing protein [Eubacterium sp.]|nr:DUF2812 domain-containing protein [Eubacterium sp.]